MAMFRGTHKEFTTFIGPWVRNKVQYISRLEKAKKRGICEGPEHQGEGPVTLESAHVHGRGRREIIQSVLASFTDHNGLIECELGEVEKRIVAAHQPIEKAFLFLCRKCHLAYDRNGGKTGAEKNSAPTRQGQSLLILLEPQDEQAFKSRLLETGKALITVYYTDGHVEERLWRASRFNASSSVYGNLRSRPDFRNSTWQRLGIQRVQVSVCQ